MNENEINAKISLKRKEIEVHTEPNKKIELERELQILNLRKQIIFAQNKITQIRNGMN